MSGFKAYENDYLAKAASHSGPVNQEYESQSSLLENRQHRTIILWTATGAKYLNLTRKDQVTLSRIHPTTTGNLPSLRSITYPTNKHPHKENCWGAPLWGFLSPAGAIARSGGHSIHDRPFVRRTVRPYEGFRSKTQKLLDQSPPNLVYNLPIPWRGAFWGFQYFANFHFVGIHGNALKIVIFKCFRSKTQ